VLFPTHLAAAALVGRGSGLPSWWLVAGAAAPDIVDKPLGLLGIVELYHSVGHTALLVPLAVGVALSSRAGLAAAIGWGSHLLLDALHVVVNGRPGDALFLGWPLVVPTDPFAVPPGEFFLVYLWTPSFLLEGVLWAAFAVVFLGPRVAAGSRSRSDRGT